jgi:acetyl-CoA carboxylase carboxyl transferase subunit alpha
VIEEPLGGAHRNPDAAADKLEKWLIATLRELGKLKVDTLINQRWKRLRAMGQYEE